MKYISILLLLIIFSTNVGAEETKEADQDDPAARKDIIRYANALFDEGKYTDAAKHYRFGIRNWNKPEQSEDLKKACISLFALLYKTKKQTEYREMLGGCPEELVGIWYATEDRDAYPVLKSAPRYPKKAYQNNIEGWVVVEFDVSELGRVKNVKVIETSNPIFNESAMESAENYLYLPALERGVPVEKKGVKNKITFRLWP
jgi:TonB family protein